METRESKLLPVESERKSQNLARYEELNREAESKRVAAGALAPPSEARSAILELDQAARRAHPEQAPEAVQQAQAAARSIVADAEGFANRLVGDARKEAEQILADAKAAAEKLSAESQAGSTPSADSTKGADESKEPATKEGGGGKSKK